MVVALFPLAGHSLGLGKIELKSALNEPLRAEIDITSITQDELRELEVSLAPRADFAIAGAERLPLLSQIKFDVRQRPDGRYYIELTTQAPIQEPFLHVLLQVEWPNGRLVREYTALLDPPSYVAGRPSGIEAPEIAPAPAPAAPAARAPGSVHTVPPPLASGRTSSDSPARAPTPVPRADAPARALETPPPETADRMRDMAVAPAPRAVEPAAAPEPAAPTDWASVTEYTVRPGDTLWGIAERVRADRGMTLEQVILAIFRNNPDAFHLDNVNYMFAGKVLRMPERDEVESVGATAARREFRTQYAAWQEYKTQLAARSRTLTVAESEPQAEPAPEPADAPEAAESAEPAETADAPAAQAEAEQAASGDQASGELLKIVRAPEAEEAGAGDGGAESESVDPEGREQAALADRVTTLEESLASQQLENRELSEKVGQVRSQIENEKRLIELENEALARQTAKAPAEQTPASAPKPAQEATPPPQAEAPAAAAPGRAAPKPKPAAKPAPQPAPPPEPQKGLIATVLDDLLQNPFLPMIGGGVALLAGLILMVYVRRRRRSIAEFEESILATDGVATDGVSTTETASQAATGDTSFLSDFSKSGMGQMHTDEVDPIAEAEVYLAYGRDETAEEILKEAIVKNPERHELKQKLLEIYHQRNDVHAFETLAEELYAALGGPGGKIWERVEEMGRALNPENPMFRGGGAAPQPRPPGAPAPLAPAAPVADAPTTVVFEPGLDTQASAPADDSLNFDPPEDNALSFDPPQESGLSLDAASDDKASIDFSFDAPAAEAPAEDEPAASAGADGGLDFDLGTEPLGGAGEDAAQSAAPDTGTDADSLESLELGTPADNLIDFESARQEAGAQSVPDTAQTGDTEDLGDEEIKWEMDVPVEEAAAAETAEGDGGEPDDANGSWDETATKLDLAKAYIDMGDAEGARNILEEVMAEGNEQQKQQAAELASQIA